MQISQTTNMQNIPMQYKNGDPFEGELPGRRLLQVSGSRTLGAKYRFSDAADTFWLALESDTAEQIIWISPQWQYCGPSAGFELRMNSQVLEVGRLPTMKAGDFKYAAPSWQALTGLFLSEIQIKSAYDEQRGAALMLSFSPVSVPLPNLNTAKILFDSPDLDEPFIMVTSDDKVLGQWVLRGDVQGYLNTPRRAWDAPWNTPVYPWDFKQHFEVLSKFRQELQGFLLWAATEAGLQYPRTLSAFPLGKLWTVLRELSVFEIALAWGIHWVQKDNSWLDQDGDDYEPSWYGAAWVSLGIPLKTEKTIASSLRSSKHSWRHLMSRDEWQRTPDS